MYIGRVKKEKWRSDPEPDDDRELDSTPKHVIQILGFDPAKEFEDERPKRRRAK